MLSLATAPTARRRPGIAAAVDRIVAVIGVDPTLLTQSLFLLAATVLGQAANFGVQILLARQLGVDGFGLYSYVLGWAFLLSLLAVLGGDRLLIRFLGEYRATRRLGWQRALVAWTLAVTTGSSLLAGAAMLSLGWLAPALAHSPSVGALLGWGVALVVLQALVRLLEGALRGSEAHTAATLLASLLRPALLALALLLPAWLAAGGPGPAGAMMLTALALVPVALLGAALLPARLPARATRDGPPPLRQWLAAALAFAVNTLALQLNGQIDLLVLGLFYGDGVLGAYGAAVRLLVVVTFASTAVIAVIQPMIVRVATGGDGDELRRLVRGGARVVYLSSAGCALAILLLADPLLAVFGPGFGDAALPLRILAGGQLLSSLVSLAGPLLSMTGHQLRVTRIMLAGAGLNLALNLLAVPRYGMVGAAVATAASWGAWNLALFSAARARLGVEAAPWPLGRRPARG